MSRKRSADKDLSCTAVETTARDLLQNWNEYYVKNDFGIGVQCIECHKWRLTHQYQESKEVPKKWTCSMWEIDKSKTGNCSIPSDLTEEDFAQEDYPPGTLVWAKLSKFPWWPAMIEDSPDTQQFFVVDEKNKGEYHVNFFGEPQRSWVKASYIKEFFGSTENPNKNSINSAKFKKSIEEADDALKLPIKERLQKYSFALRYKGRWPKIKDEDHISLPPGCPSNKKVPKFAELKSAANNKDQPENGDKHQAPTLHQQSSGNNGVSNHLSTITRRDEIRVLKIDRGCQVDKLTQEDSIKSNDSAHGSDEAQPEENDILLDNYHDEESEDGEGMCNPYDPVDKKVYSASEMRKIAKEYEDLFHHPGFQEIIYPFNTKDRLYIRDNEKSFLQYHSI